MRKRTYDETTLLGLPEMLTQREINVIRLQAFGTRIAIYCFLATFISLAVGFIGIAVSGLLFDDFISSTYTSSVVEFKNTYLIVWIVLSLIPLIPFGIFALWTKMKMRDFYLIVGKTRTMLNETHRTVKELEDDDTYTHTTEFSKKKKFFKAVDHLSHDRTSAEDIGMDIESSLNIIASFDRIAHKAQFLLHFYHLNDHTRFCRLILYVPLIFMLIFSGMNIKVSKEAKDFVVNNHKITYDSIQDVLQDYGRVNSSNVDEANCSIYFYLYEEQYEKVYAVFNINPEGKVIDVNYNYQWDTCYEDYESGDTIQLDDPSIKEIESKLNELQDVVCKCKGFMISSNTLSIPVRLSDDLKAAMKKKEDYNKSIYKDENGLQYRDYEAYDTNYNSDSLYILIDEKKEAQE